MPDQEQPLVEGIDYVMEGPYLVFTAAYLLKRGYCCNSGCRNCPWRLGEKREEPRERSSRTRTHGAGDSDATR